MEILLRTLTGQEKLIFPRAESMLCCFCNELSTLTISSLSPEGLQILLPFAEHRTQFLLVVWKPPVDHQSLLAFFLAECPAPNHSHILCLDFSGGC